MIDSAEDISIDDLRETLHYIENITNITNFSLDDLRMMNRKTNKDLINKEKIDLAELIESVISLAKSKIKFAGKRIKITYDIATSVEDHIVSDSKKLKHILFGESCERLMRFIINGNLNYKTSLH